MVKFNGQRLIFGLVVLLFIVITEFVTGYFKLPSWPAYAAWVLFFLEHMDPKKAPPILVGAVAGLVLIAIAPAVIGLLAQLIGPDWGRLVYILAAVYSIFAFGEMIPLVLNNYAFMILTIAGVALQAPNPNPYLWMVMAAVGGGLLIGGTILAGRLMGAPAAPAHADLR
jgi:hypothetical protein